MLRGFLVTKSSLLKEEYSQTNTKIIFQRSIYSYLRKTETATLQP